MRSDVRIPAGLEWWRAEQGGAEWLDALPTLVAECAESWGLDVGDPFEPPSVSYVARVTRSDGAPAVLKVRFPHPDSQHEPEALAHWGGEGAARLLEHDSERDALLVELCEPGTPLWDAPEEEALAVAAAVLRRIWRPGPREGPFRRLVDEAARWSEDIPARWQRLGRPYERELVDEAVDFLRAAHWDEQLVVNQDLHGGNILRAEREPWLVIDPKPLVGERAFETTSLLRDRRPELARHPRPAAVVGRRLDFFAEELGLDRERMRGWGIAHALAWGTTDSEVMPMHLACARWLAAA